MYWFKDIQALQLLHDRQHAERDKGNRSIKLDIDTSCDRCYTVPKVTGEQFDNFCEIFADYTNATHFSGWSVKMFKEILLIDILNEEEKFGQKFEQLLWSFRYAKDFKKQNGELKNLFIVTMRLSEKFSFGNEETKRRMKAHYEAEFKADRK